jgi:serine/threonine protein kinase/tetratricopeptide (TPR) repeat protein
MANLVLGPFRLEHRIGRGGMSDVWQAVHVSDHVRVAVKVLTAERARKPANLRMFRTEIRAVSRLDHPHVIGVHDAGLVPAEVAAASKGTLQPRMPYLVMDLLGGGSLWDYRGRLPWSDLKGLLLRLLDALAHAHARGVIHRDLKLTNVLLTHPERRAVITDFGLAQLRRDDQAVHLPAGTPNYMAPEQFRDQWRDFGPWTDLYGFGCLAWALATGAAPFTDPDWTVVREHHLYGEPPAFEPTIDVPDGFEPWLRGLLLRDLALRCQRAADAAWALEQLPDTVQASSRRRAEPPQQLLPPSTHEASTLTFGTDPAALLESLTPGRLDAPPPPPAHWEGLPPRPRLQLRGTGLGLYASRAIPTVGRRTERDLLWRQVVALHGESPEVRGVTLEGAAGTGKTHLVRWLSERAHELGAAHVLWCDHAVRGGPTFGLAGMLRSHLHASGLAGPALMKRVTHAARSWGTTDGTDQAVLAEIMGDEPTLSGGASLTATATSASSSEALAVLRRHIRHMAARRPVMLVLDDAQRGVDALLLARSLFRDEPVRLLVVSILRDEALPPTVGDLVTQVQQRSERLRVDPLPDVDQLDLVRELLGLEGELARRVAKRTQGNPAFAVALVADWIARDQLVRGPGGFRLRRDADDALPANLFALWTDDLRRALSGVDTRKRQAIDLGAVLGMQVDTLRWRRIAARAGLDADLEVLDALATHGLVEGQRPSRSWRFAHAMVREALLRTADDEGRLADLHRWVLEDLERQPSLDAEEHARHLLGAGRASEAVGRWVQAARDISLVGHPHGVLDLLDRAEQTVRQQPDLERRWRRELDVGRVSAYVLLGRLDEALQAAERVLPAFADAPDHPDRAWVQTLQARVALFRGDAQTTRSLCQQVIARLRPDDDLPPTHPERLADALRVLGLLHFQQGRLPRAEATLREARTHAEHAGAGGMWAETTGFLAMTLVQRGRTHEAHKVLEEALASPHLGSRALRASLINTRAELYRALGRSRLAAADYAEAVHLLEQIGSLEASVPRLNLAILAAIDERYDEAWGLAERCGHEGTVQGRPPLQLAVHAVLLVAAVGLRHVQVVREQLERLAALTEAGTTGSSDADQLLGLATAMLSQGGHHAEAAAAESLRRRWTE